MKKNKKVFVLLSSLVLLLSSLIPSCYVFADTQTTNGEPVSNIQVYSEEYIQNEINKYTLQKQSGLISQYDYDSIVMILKSLNATDGISTRSAYYPERQVSRINYAGVKYLYEHGLKKGQIANAISSGVFGAVPGYGWGITALGVVTSFGGYDTFEKAVQQAYYQKKGINVYYKIHKSIQSLNTVRYVVA